MPIVEPEVLMDGAHSIERCEAVTSATLVAVFDQLHAHRIHLEGMILKPNMVISARNARRARMRSRWPKRPSVASSGTYVRRAGVAFLSAGQSPAEATEHLSLMNKLGPLPWELTFS